MCDVPTNIDVDLCVDVNANAFGDAMGAFNFVRPPPSEEFRGWSALNRRPTDALERAHVLQAWMPSYHV